jgi:hypothetical protein
MTLAAGWIFAEQAASIRVYSASATTTLPSSAGRHVEDQPMYRMYRVHVFQANVDDKPGGTAEKLKHLADAGVHLEYVHSERGDLKPAHGVLVVAPRQVKSEMDICKQHGFRELPEPIVMRFEGDDKTGLGQRVTMEWEKAGINLHGLMMAAVGGKFVGYAHFDHVEDANKAAELLALLGSKEV